MGTKNNPGDFDCYANAHPDEPMFVLLGRDRHAAALVRFWAHLRAREGEDEAKVSEAQHCAEMMDAWARKLGKTPAGHGPFRCGACGEMFVTTGQSSIPVRWLLDRPVKRRQMKSFKHRS